MVADRNSQKIVIAGASSLLGHEVKSMLEEGRFAGWDFHLVDEDATAGIITEAAGEAALIQRVEEGTFRGARFAFLAGSPAFGKACWRRPKTPARRSLISTLRLRIRMQLRGSRKLKRSPAGVLIETRKHSVFFPSEE